MVGKKGTATKLLDIVFFKNQLTPQSWVFTDFEGYFVAKDISSLSLRDVVTSVLGSLIGSRSSQFSNEDLMKSIECFGSSKICCVAGHHTRRQLLNINELCRLNSLFKNGIDFFQLFRVPNRSFLDTVFYYNYRTQRIQSCSIQAFYTPAPYLTEVYNSVEKIRLIKAGRQIVSLVLASFRETKFLRLLDMTLLFIMEEKTMDCWFIGAQNCNLQDITQQSISRAPCIHSMAAQAQTLYPRRDSKCADRVITQHQKFNKRINRQKYLYLKNNSRFLKMTAQRSVSPLTNIKQLEFPEMNKSFNVGAAQPLNTSLSLNNELLKSSLHRILRASPVMDNVSVLPARRQSAADVIRPQVKEQDEFKDINPLDSRPHLPRLLMTNNALLATIQTSSLKKVASHADKPMQTSGINWRRSSNQTRNQWQTRGTEVGLRGKSITPEMITLPDQRKSMQQEPQKLEELLETFDNTKVRKALHKITPKATKKRIEYKRERMMRSTLGFIGPTRITGGARSSQQLRATTSPSQARIFSKGISDIFTDETPREGGGSRQIEIDSPPQNSALQETINTRVSQQKYLDFEANMSQVTGSAITIQERQTTPKKLRAPYQSVGSKSRAVASPLIQESEAPRVTEKMDRQSATKIKRHTTYGNMMVATELEKEIKHARSNSTTLSKSRGVTGSHLVLRMPSIAAEEVGLGSEEGRQAAANT